MPDLRIGGHVVVYDMEDEALVLGRKWGVECRKDMLYGIGRYAEWAV